MKSPIFSLFLIGAAATTMFLQTARADDSTANAQTTPSTGASDSTSTTQGQGQRWARFKAAFAQLDLTDVQKAQIKQIRTTVTDRKERRQEVMAVLTPDQKAKLRQLIQENKSGAPTGDNAPLAPDAN